MVEILFARKDAIDDIVATLATAPIVTTATDVQLGNEQVLTDSTSVKVSAGGLGTVSHVRAALTGDVTASQDSNATTIAADAVDNTKLANMVEATFKMRAAASGTGDPIDGTATQAKTALAITAADVSGGAALTKVDDTNVTLTLGGTPTQALLRATSITVGWTGTLAAARLNANVVQAVTNDTNVTGSIGTQTITLGWTGTLAAARLNSAVVQAVTNDTNINGSISAQNLTFSWAGTLAVSRGGLGVGTVTGLMQGNGTSAVTTVANSSTVGQVLRVTGAATYGWGALDLADTDAITGDLPYANLAQGSGLSVLGVTGASTADNASMVAGTDGHVMRRSGSAVGFGTIATAGIAAAAVTFATMQNIATDSLIGRDTAGTGVPENITLGASLSMTGAQVLQRAALTGDVTAAAGSNATVALLASTSWSFTGISSPAQITSNQNNYVISTTSVLLRLFTDAARQLTGIVAGTTGQVIVIWNIGSFDLTLVNESASSTAGNRFAVSADVTIAANQSAMLGYDITSARWRMIGGSGGGGGGGGAPTTSQYVTLATDGTLSNERVLTAGVGITLTDAGAGSTITVTGTKKADYQEFTGSGTWTKPTGYGAEAYALLEAWGGGGGGARVASTSNASGGGGGACKRRWMLLSDMGATETITIAAGGVGRITTTGVGTNGGNTTIGTLVTAYGGQGGPGDGNFGKGGGLFAAAIVTSIFASEEGGFSACASSAASGSVDGGGGGGCFTFTAGGVSQHASSGATGVVGTPTTPGFAGGGGASTAANVNGGNGGGGKVRITVFDGA